MELGVFIPIGNNGWLISTTSPQYKPSFDLNLEVVQKAERFGFDFALSMIKLHGFGGPSQFWDYNLESFTLMAGLASVTSRIQLFATCAVLTLPPPIAARMAVTIDSISHGRFGVNIISGWQRRAYTQMGIWPGAEHYRRRYDYCAEYVTIMFVIVSFWDYDRTGIYPAFTLQNYQDLLTTPATIRVYVSSLMFAVIVWAITLFLGFNIAHFLIFHVRSAAVRTVFFLLIAIPFWTSGIIRTIAWIPFLGRNGAFNQMLIGAGITSQPLDFLLFSSFAVVVTYVNLFTLLMVGPIANSLAKIDPALIEAARDAGASRWRIMVEVIIPLSKTGIALGSILVFTQVMGDFFVVKAMSGGQSASIVSALATEIQAMQYPPAAANSVVLVIFVAIMVALMMRVVDVRKELVK
jgi:putative spermidine/putrescine transport system permease protein